MKALAVLFTLVALEEPSPNWPADGCYARDYDAAHLAANPAQVVEEMFLEVNYGPAVGFHAALFVRIADQGRAARDRLGGRSFEQMLFCDDPDGVTQCETECPGDGGFAVTRDEGGMIEITTDHLQVGPSGACPRGLDLAESPGRPVTFRLFSVPLENCYP
ncbi:MAG TPA: hypothetical protein PKD10_13410 [Paracoccaceae bacterium]|nr:hypothetical protein [Paracoccaceae bacterium]HMO70723.1 hypothetical protein [Paracoccaceae bacterium]